jgi:hypothetical protein
MEWNMRLKMTPLESRGHVDGFGLAIMLLGYGLCALLLVLALMALFGVRSGPTPPLAFQALVLIALGSGLRLLVRIDKRLEAGGNGPAASPD